MKSRWTTYLLLAAVVVVWGVVAWRIFTPSSDAIPPQVPIPKAAVAATPTVDTLSLNYPDPFLKGSPGKAVTLSPSVQALPPPKPAPIRRERVKILHTGTICVTGRPLYILTIGEQQYELRPGEAAADFLLTAVDSDSLYLSKEGVTYGVRLCE